MKPLLEPLHPTDRLGPEDQAARAAALFLADAIVAQQMRAQRVVRASPGVCTNCGARCRLLAVYCDPECRSDHEARQAVRARQGTAPPWKG